MNMNMNLDLKSLKVNPAVILPLLKRARAAIVGVVLIGVFGYTAYAVNAALNVTPAVVPATPVGISFDKGTLDSLKNLTPVPDTVAPASLGKSDPFGTN